MRFNGIRYYHTKGDYLTFHKRKLFFATFAHHYKFDPSQPGEWYSIFTGHLLLQRGGKKIVQYYNGSVIKGLLDVYPNMQLDIYKFHAIEIDKYNKTTSLEQARTTRYWVLATHDAQIRGEEQLPSRMHVNCAHLVILL